MRTLREYRESKGVKQIAVARYLGVTRQTYSRYEDHPERMTIAQAMTVCEFLSIDFDYLVKEFIKPEEA